MEKKIIHTSNAPEAIGPYSQAAQIGNMLFMSGQIAINPKSGVLEMTDISAETHQVMKNILAVLAAAEFDLSHVVKTTIFLSDMNYFQEVNTVYASYFLGSYPARETVAVAGLPKNVNVEISMIAHK
jgi:2-iminobutanoate/2-iminopropanoate deaminase